MDPNQPRYTPQNNNANPEPNSGVYSSPNLNPATYGPQPASQPQQTSGGNPQLSSNKGPSKLVLIVIAGVVLVVILGVIAVLSSSGNKNKTEQVTQQPAGTTQSQNLKPAEAIDLQEASNAISQDISSLDDEKNFPADSLDDKTLGL